MGSDLQTPHVMQAKESTRRSGGCAKANLSGASGPGLLPLTVGNFKTQKVTDKKKPVAGE